MNTARHGLKGLLAVLLLWAPALQAQIVSPAVPDIVLDVSSPSCTPMDIAYNPGQQLYYSVYGGNPSCPIITHDGTTGSELLVTSPSTHDWRGIWWNAGIGGPEGNPCSSCDREAIWAPDLDGAGLALATGTVTLTPSNQPDFQSQGDLDTDANEIVYYFNNQIFRVDRATNANLPTVSLSGTPGGTTFNENLIGYSGIAGAEYMLWDYSNDRVLFYDRTGAYQGDSPVPGAPATSADWRVGFANGRVFIWNGAGWNGYVVGPGSSPPPPPPPSGATPVPTLGAGLLALLTLLVGWLGAAQLRARPR